MNDENSNIQEAKAFDIGAFRPEDAEGIVQLFRAVYGDGYPIRLFYDPNAIIAANQEGLYCSIVARTPCGKVIGVGHLCRSAPFNFLYEWTAGLVLKQYRNLGVNKAIAQFLHQTFVPGKPFIEELFGEPVCNHTQLQKVTRDLGYVETAIEVALMPAEAYTREKSATGRVATLMTFRCNKPRHHAVFLPPVYEVILRQIYARLDDGRTITLDRANTPSGKQTRTDITIFGFARVARIAVHETGSDFDTCLDQLEKQARDQDVLVFQVWLKLTEPWVGEAVVILRSRGYFFGGALPRWFDEDGLLMQKIDCPPDFERIALLSGFSRELLAVIRADFDRSF
ncbi:hypothetical protein [Desulfatirhabdium butyrativorans]|uniref:hypothetical protein n=1 Tax=Desulfatirhabdium butyrativorans TaxID=340467 RepID=UPI000422FF4F|nr:hypothetical protein [Desulfatirhabdium butyrativorans]